MVSIKHEHITESCCSDLMYAKDTIHRVNSVRDQDSPDVVDARTFKKTGFFLASGKSDYSPAKVSVEVTPKSN